MPVWWPSIHFFFSRICFSSCSAVLGSSQKFGASVRSSSSSASTRFLSTSKIPPQGFKPLTEFFYLLRSNHGHGFYVLQFGLQPAKLINQAVNSAFLMNNLPYQRGLEAFLNGILRKLCLVFERVAFINSFF